MPEYTKFRSEEPIKFPDQFVDEERRTKWETKQISLLRAVKKATQAAQRIQKDIKSERSNGKPFFKDIETEEKVVRTLRLAENLSFDLETIVSAKLCKITNPVIRK